MARLRVWRSIRGPKAKHLEQASNRRSHIDAVVVISQEMRDIESRIFAAGMPVAALMEKVGGLIAQRIQTLYPRRQFTRVGVLVGPGHNGGDALVVARELWFQGYQVQIFRPLPNAKQLTHQHAQFAQSLGIPFVSQVEAFQNADLLIDGLFGFGLERSLSGDLAALVDQINLWSIPVISIDIPSGLHTDTGASLGTALKAQRTLCLGLWKLGLLQDQALDYVGIAELIDFDIPAADITAILGSTPALQRITPSQAMAQLPLPRSQSTHKYQQGHLLLIGGSQRYAGSIILAGLGARATGIGMLSIAVPATLKPLLVAQLPEALILSCPETAEGAILQLPAEMNLTTYDAIAYGPGVTTAITQVLDQVLSSTCPLVLDADGLNLLAQKGVAQLQSRPALTILTPHPGEFKRLFPALTTDGMSRIGMTRQAAAETGAIVLLKGARTVIANPEGSILINPESTPALARGGSGDVLTGLVGGLLAQAVCNQTSTELVVPSAVWWHAQAGRFAAQKYTDLGVDALTLTKSLIPTLTALIS